MKNNFVIIGSLLLLCGKYGWWITLSLFLCSCISVEQSDSVSEVTENAAVVAVAAPVATVVGPPAVVSYAADGSPPADEWFGNSVPPVAEETFDPNGFGIDGQQVDNEVSFDQGLPEFEPFEL